jgi:hypothetical protein
MTDHEFSDAERSSHSLLGPGSDTGQGFMGIRTREHDPRNGSTTAQSLFDALRWKAKSRLVAPLGSQLMSLGSSMKRLCLRIP